MSLILGAADSSGIVAADFRNALSTVFEGANSAREMSRAPQLGQEIADYHGERRARKKYKMIRSFLTFSPNIQPELFHS
jgi:hypothetical protein